MSNATARLYEQHTALIAAREIMKMILPSYPDYPSDAPFTPLDEAAKRWRERFEHLVDTPSGEPRDTPEAARERAAWTRDVATMLREQTEVMPELRAGIVWAADWLDPPKTVPVTLKVGDKTLGAQDIPIEAGHRYVIETNSVEMQPVFPPRVEPSGERIPIVVEDEPDIVGADAPGAMEREP